MRIGQHIGHTLRAIRHAANLTQIELAERMSTSQSAVARIEAAPSPTTRAMREYVAALGYDFALLIFPAGSPYKTVRLTSALTRASRRWGQRIAAGQVVTPIVSYGLPR